MNSAECRPRVQALNQQRIMNETKENQEVHVHLNEMNVSQFNHEKVNQNKANVSKWAEFVESD